MIKGRPLDQRTTRKLFLLKISKQKMETERRAQLVYSLVSAYTALCDTYDANEMEAFKIALEPLCGESIHHVAVTGELEDVQFHLEGALVSLMETVNKDSHENHRSLINTNWRRLFNICPASAIEVNVETPTDDDNSSGASSSDLPAAKEETSPE